MLTGIFHFALEYWKPLHTAQNAVISPNFLMRKVCENAISVEFWAKRSKLWENCAFPQNFHTRKLGEITAFYAVCNNYCVKRTILNNFKLYDLD